MYILVLNAGSSSLKYKLFNLPRLIQVADGNVSSIGQGTIKTHDQALRNVLKELKTYLPEIKTIAHRVVHGGEAFTKPTILTKPIIQKLQKLSPLAPLHNPHNVACIRACQKLFPKTTNIAVFDTSFYSTLPAKAYIYGLPYSYYTKEKIRRYGFHGISHSYLLAQTAAQLKIKQSNLNIITCHLGAGCSITAIKNGKAVDTSMGYTPTEGLLMATRTGDLDPGILLHLAHTKGVKTDLQSLVNNHSGWLGISGISANMKDIEQKSKQGHKRARLALDIFVYRVQKYIGAYTAVLDRVDAVVFSGGVGENSAFIRSQITKNLPLKTKYLVIKTNEELQIAKEALKCLKS